MARQVDADAAVGVARGVDDVGPVPEAQRVPVLQLVVDRGGRGLGDGQAVRVQRDLPVQEHRFGNGPLAPDHGRVQPVREHPRPPAGGEFTGRAHVVAVAVREDDPLQPFGEQPEGTYRPFDRRGGFGVARVDEGERSAVLPEIRLADGEAEHVEPVREHFDKIHTVNVRTARRPGHATSP